MRRYLALLAVTLVAAAGLAVVARAPRRAAREAPVARPAPLVELAVTVEDGTIAPVVTTVSKGHRVRFTIANAGRAPARVALAGYEDRLAVPRLEPGARWTGELLADRPGEDFAWLVDGQPAGRFAVQGSHLVEGHR